MNDGKWSEWWTQVVGGPELTSKVRLKSFALCFRCGAVVQRDHQAVHDFWHAQHGDTR